MEEPSSPLSPSLSPPRMLSGQLQPVLADPGMAARSSLASSHAYPEVCLLPSAKASNSLTCGLPKPRHGYQSSLLQNEVAGAFLSSGEAKDEDTSTSTHRSTPMLHVDCHLVPPQTTWEHQPITPSPQASSAPNAHISAGWRIPSFAPVRKSSSNEMGMGG